MKKNAVLLLGVLMFSQSDFAQSYQDIADSQTVPGINCSQCHTDGRVWEATPLSAPVITVSTSGLDVTLTWISTPSATGYTLYYALNPYTGPESISSVDMGVGTDFSATLWDGASFYVAITAYNDGSGESEYSNVGLFTIHETEINDGAVQTVTSAGRVWMDRNLGASRVATSSTDELAYGDLYQWGRGADGHESRNSGATTTTSSTDTPGHGNFITSDISNADWRVPRNDNLWLGSTGINNPCPTGYRLPTSTEWETELASWTGSGNTVSAFNSPLRLVLAGERNYETAEFENVGYGGDYWASTTYMLNARNMAFASRESNVRSQFRARGMSVRCIKD